MMKKVLCLAACLAAFDASAGVCNAKTVAGAYTYSAAAVTAGAASFGAGSITFDGVGKVAVAAVSVSGGNAAIGNTTGTYSVTAGCVAQVAMANGSKLTIFLNKLDVVPAVNVAYHGKIIFVNQGLKYSGLGDLDRVAGKF